MSGTYDPGLVALSLAVAIMASYTALELAGRVSDRHAMRRAWAWLAAGAISMGIGIWSMHFIGMLAFHLPVPLAYDAPITLLSMAIAIAVSGIALFVVKRPAPTPGNFALGAAFMGAGICAMHYTGMHAMRMSPPIVYDPALFAASIAIAMGASLAVLWLAFKLRHKQSRLAVLAKLGSAGVMGLAITGMHYTGMAAAQFAPDAVCLAADSTGGMTNAALGHLIGVATFGILSVTVVISALDAHFAAHSAKLADSLQAANAQLRNLALYDTLTGLPNRMLLDDRVAQALSRAAREQGSFALMFVDLDGFKPVNDRYGHGAGDALLKGVARRLADCVRKSDTVARLGGDEFVILLGEIAEPRDAELVGGKALGELQRPFFIDRAEIAISCSIGVSVYPADGLDAGTLMIKADAAVDHAQRGG
jgi:diguanylate cyclase (GGDEF)-like protein